MPSFDDIRSRYPGAKDLNDEEIITRTAEITGLPFQQVAADFGYDINKSRGLFTTANDAVIEFGNAVAGLPKAALDLAVPGSEASKAIGDFISEGEKKQSLKIQAEKQKLSEAMQSDSTWDQITGAAKYVASNPLIAGSQALGSFVGPGVAIKGGKLAASALNLGEKAAGRVSLGTGAATTGVLSGGDAAGDAYDMVMNSPNLQNMSAEERHELATDAARKASVVPFVLGAGSSFLPGAEKALATGTKSIFKTGATEFASEAFEEGSTKLSANLAAQQYAPEVKTMQGVAGAATLGGLLGGGTGLAVGALTKQPDSFLPGSTNSSTGETNPDNNAINKAIDANSSEIATDTPLQLDAIKQQQVELDQANLQAKAQADEVAAQQVQAQAQAQSEAAQQEFNYKSAVYGIKALDVANQYRIGNKQFFNTAQAQQFIQGMEELNQGLGDELKFMIGAAVNSGALKIDQKATPKSVNNAAVKFLSDYGLADATGVDDAVGRVEAIISTLEGPKALKEADQLNSFYKSITGTDSPAFVSLQQLAAETTPKKGASNEQLQLQNNAGLREVPVQGGTTQTGGTGTGNVRPISVQPVGTTSLGEGSLGLQTGTIPSSGVPTSTATTPSGAIDTNAVQGQTEVIEDDRVFAINEIEKMANAAFGTRDAKIILEFIATDGALNKAKIADKLGLSRARITQITGAPKEGESFNEQIERMAAEKWGPKLFIEGKRMGYTQADMLALFETTAKAQDEMAAETGETVNDQESEINAAPPTEDIYNTNADDVNPAFSDEANYGTEIGNEELSTSDEDGGQTASGYRIFNPKVSGTSELEDASSNNRTRQKLKTTDLKNLKDFELNNLASDDETSAEEVLQIAEELTKRQEKRVAKGAKNAVQEPSPKSETVGNKPKVSKGVRKQDTEGGEAATESKPAQENVGKTPEEIASKSWDEGIKGFPDAPKFSELTAEQQSDWISYGEENWTPADVQTELVKLAKQPKYALGIKKRKNAWAATELIKHLKEMFASDESFNEIVTIVDTVYDLEPTLRDEILAEVDPSWPGGFAEDGRAYLIANNIKKGTELSVFLHEVGGHLGMEKLIGTHNMEKMSAQIKKWASGSGSAIEVSVAKRAIAKVNEAAAIVPMDENIRKEEIIAYFVEEAILAGVNPTATEVKGAGQIIQFLRSIVASMKLALRKIRFNKFDELTARHVVDLAFGAAKLELDGTYHGTKNEFRKFLDDKISNVLSGWGHYNTNDKIESKTHGKKTMRTLFMGNRKDLIQNDRPLEDQPAVLKKLRAVADPKFQSFLKEQGVQIDGGDLQDALGQYEIDSEGGLYKLLSPSAQNRVVEVKEIVSTFLAEQGIPGSTFKPYGRGAPNRQTIVFQGKDLARVSQETKNGLRFSIEKAREESVKQMNKLPKEIRTPLQHTVDNIFDFAKKGLIAFTFTEDLANMAAKYIKSARHYVDLMKNRQAIRTRYERNIDLILQQYDKLPTEVRGTGEKSVNRFLMDTTMEGKWAYNPGWIKNFDETKDIDPDMKARFDAMPAPAQEVIKQVFVHGQHTLQAMQKSVIENVHTEYDALIAEAKRQGDAKQEAELTKSKINAITEYRSLLRTNNNKPYAPLKRFGNYVVVGKSQQYIDNEAIANSKTASPDKIAEARKELRKLEKNDMDLYVRFAETAGEANAIVREEAGNYDYIEHFEKDSSKNAGQTDLNDVVNRLRNLADENTDSSMSEAANKALNRMIVDLRLTLLSEQSARQSERRRRGIAGAEPDMMRSFATQGRATASFIASLENSSEIYETLRDMKKEADAYDGVGTRAERRRYYNEFVKRHFMGMDYQPSPFIDKALSTTSMWMLLTNPAYYLQNMTQPFMMSLPVIGARYGYNRSWKEMTRAYTDIAAVIKKHGLGEESYSKLPEDVRQVIEELVNRGRIDISLEQDLGRWRSTEDSKMAKFGRASELLRGMAQDIETINRVATAVAAYRLALKGPKGNQRMAIDYADKIIYDTHGDYTSANAPRIMRTVIGRVATQFRKFQLIQISLMAKLSHDAFVNEDKDTRAIGKRALMFTLGHTAVMGGIMGLPGFAAIAALYGMLFGDEDEPDNPELALRRAIGDDALADLLVRGAPAAAGVDVSGKLGMGQMLSVLPYTDVTLSRKGVYEAAGTLLTGPFGGLLAKSAEGMGYIGRGDYYKGLEQLVPTGLANAMKGYRYGTEGITSKTGDLTMSADEIDVLDAFGVALGLPTKTITDRQFLQSAKFDYDQFYNEKATELKREYVRAYKEGDNIAKTEAMDDWKKLQESRAQNGYTRQPLSTLIKAPQEQRKRERMTVGGVAFNKSNRGFVKRTSEL